jgi:hypothetical protein
MWMRGCYPAPKSLSLGSDKRLMFELESQLAVNGSVKPIEGIHAQVSPFMICERHMDSPADHDARVLASDIIRP